MKNISLFWVILTSLVLGVACGDDDSDKEEETPDAGNDAGNDNEEDGCGEPFCNDIEVPDDADPAEIGAVVATLFDSKLSAKTIDLHYKTACTWYGALQIADLTEDDELLESLIGKFDHYIEDNAFDEFLAESGTVDDNVYGIVPFEIYKINGDEKVLETGVTIADHQLDNRNAPGQRRYAIDDMFMVTGLQVQAYRATGDDKYIEFMASRMNAYLEKLQEDDGCFYQIQAAKIKWGRGNGWFAAGMAEILLDLDKDNEYYDVIFEGYTKMMEGLLKYQIKDGEDAGLWKQIIDDDGDDNWAETSGTAMFTYAMIVGVRNGWLDPDTYTDAALNGWLALVKKMTNEDGEMDGKLQGISDWCYWTDERGEPREYYLGRPSLTADGHGQAPVLWAAAALLR